MVRKTIDFGIDLGTTNSVIACMDRGELVIIRNQVTNSEVTPSAVKMDARGSVTVGQNAYNELEFDPDNAVGEFKRWMGNPQVDGFTFKKAGKRMTAAELSGEVLKNLRRSAAVRFGGEELNAAVITVPAHFLIPACEDTRAAAKLAGIEVGPFIQEPVAAALAYEYKAESLPGKLLVFDLGGGTFDASLLSASDGKLVVLGLDGDDKLGGKDFDWALVEVIVRRIRQEYGDIPLSRGNPSAKRAMATFKYRAEEAKKTLSALERESVEIRRLGPPFEDIDTVVELTRPDLQRATEDLTARCISISNRLLKQCDLSRDDLANVLVVGGQTQTPYIREAILSEFGKAEFRLDPLTVVAAGAALYASMQRIPRTSKPASASGSVSLDIAYQPVASDLDADIGIAIEPAPHGATVTILRVDGGWSSGAIPVTASGKVSTLVVLRPKRVNSFEVQLNDARGSRIRTSESMFSITQGLIPPQAATSRALAVALVDNTAEVLLRKGSPLPAKGIRTFITAHDVIAGDPKSILRIYFLEGEHPRSDRNIAIGTFELHGKDLRRTLVGGEEVEISYRLDDDKTLSAQAFFPAVKETCVMVRVHGRPELLPLEIDVEMKREKDRLADLKSAAPESVDPWIGKRIQDVERDMEAAADNPDEAQRAAQQTLEIKAAIDDLDKELEWELVATKLDNFRGPARDLCQTAGTKEQVKTIEDLIRSAEDALSRRDIPVLTAAVEKLKDAYWEINSTRDEFWEGYFAHLLEEADFVDPLKAERLKEQGTRALERSDIRSLRTTVRNLHALLPISQKSKLDLIYPGEILSPR
jgi:molecular chaperone DnaK